MGRYSELFRVAVIKCQISGMFYIVDNFIECVTIMLRKLKECIHFCNNEDSDLFLEAVMLVIKWLII